MAGQNITITYQVTNNGGNPANGSWNDSLYLSPTADVERRATRCWARSARRRISRPAAVTRARLTAPLPGVAPGSYYVILRTNILNTLPGADAEQQPERVVDADRNRRTRARRWARPPTAPLNQGQSAYYKVVVRAGQTLQVS